MKRAANFLIVCEKQSDQITLACMRWIQLSRYTLIHMYIIISLAGIVEPVIITPNGGQFSGGVRVSLSTSTPSSTIVYTVLNTNTGSAFNKTYTAPFNLSSADAILRITAFAERPNWVRSASSSADFFITCRRGRKWDLRYLYPPLFFKKKQFELFSRGRRWGRRKSMWDCDSGL